MKRLLPLLALCALALPASAALPGPSSGESFLKGAMFAVAGYTNANGTARSTTLANFPVLVRLAENSPSGFSYSDMTSPTGDDLCFIDMDGNGLPFEIDEWHPNGTSLVWVRLPSMTNGAEFVMCWGGGTSGKTVCNESPFSGYVGVWHMSESSGTVADSSGHSLDAEPTGTGAATLSIAVSGPVGNGRQCSNSTSTRSYLKIPSYDSQNVGNTFAVSGWFDVKTGQTAQDGRMFARKKNWQNANGWEVVWKKSKEVSTRGANTAAMAKYNSEFGEGWKHFFIVYNNKTSTIYENGVQKAQNANGTAATDNNVDLGIGDYPGNDNAAPLVGSVDECRLLDAVPDANWAWAEYASMADSAFLSSGEAESYGGVLPPAVSVSVTDTQFTNASFTVFVGSIGTGASQADVSVKFAATDDFASPLWTTNYTVFDTGSQLFSRIGLVPGTTYYVQAEIENDQQVSRSSPVVSFATPVPGPVFTANVDTDHLAPDIELSFTGMGWGSAVTRITVDVSTTGDFTSPALSKTFPVNLATMPTNVTDIVLTGLPNASPLYFRFTAENTGHYSQDVELSASSALAAGDNVWSGLSEDIADPNAYVFAGGLPAPGKTLYFTRPAGLSPVIDQDTAMPALLFTNGKTETVDTSYRSGYHSCGYNLSGSGVLTFTAEKPIVQASCGTNVIGNPILFNRSNSQTVTITSVGEEKALLLLNGSLLLPDGVSNTTVKVTGRGNTVLGGASPDFMGQLGVEGGRLTFANPNAMTNVGKISFSGDPTSMSNAIGAPLVFPRVSSAWMSSGWGGRKLHVYGAPFVFPQATFEWAIRDFEQSMFEADWVVSNVVVRKNESNGSACLGKKGAGAFIVTGETSWYDPSVKSYIRLFGGCFYPQTAAGLPPSGEFYVPNDHAWQSTIGLSRDFYPTLDGSSTPRVFQSSKWATWGFTGFGGERTVCWNADPTLNLTNTTAGTVSMPLGDAAHTNVFGKAYSDYYAYPIYFVFGNRSEFADGTVLFLNPIRYELGQAWDTKTIFESTNHVVAARMRGSLKLGTSGKTWNFSGRNFGGYLALEADNSDFTGKVNVHEKGNLLVNSNLVAPSVTVQTGSGLGGIGSLSTVNGTTVKSGGALFGGEWDKGGTLSLGGKVTFENGSAIRAEVGASNARIGMVKLAAGSTLKLGSPVYVDVDTDPRVSPFRGTSVKILDWSEATFDAGHAPATADFTARPEKNSDLEKIYVAAKDDGLYVNYVTVRCPKSTVLILR